MIEIRAAFARTPTEVYGVDPPENPSLVLQEYDAGPSKFFFGGGVATAMNL
jgi:hypothetical protein